MNGLETEVGKGFCGTSAFTGESVIVEDVSTHPYCSAYSELTAKAGIRSCWSVPFKNELGMVLGIFGIYHDQARGPGPGELQLIEEFARISGLAVLQSIAANRLRQAAAVFESTR